MFDDNPDQVAVQADRIGVRHGTSDLPFQSYGRISRPRGLRCAPSARGRAQVPREDRRRHASLRPPPPAGRIRHARGAGMSARLATGGRLPACRATAARSAARDPAHSRAPYWDTGRSSSLSGRTSSRSCAMSRHPAWLTGCWGSPIRQPPGGGMRVFATVDGYQERLVLRGRVRVAGIYVPDSTVLRGPDWKPRRGLSKEKLCVALTVDAHKNAVAADSGHGKPTSERIKDALHAHIEEGSVVVHDKEKAHGSPAKAAGSGSEAYKADVKDNSYRAAMELTDGYRSWAKRFLWCFPGMKAKNLQSYLNWFVCLSRVKRDQDKWPKTESVIRLC